MTAGHLNVSPGGLMFTLDESLSATYDTKRFVLRPSKDGCCCCCRCGVVVVVVDAVVVKTRNNLQTSE